MYHVSAKPARPRSQRYRNASLQACFLHMRRFRRVCRPLTPIILRALIVLFISIQLHPIDTQSNHATSSPLLATCSRISVLSGILSAFLSVIFFDIRVFNFMLLACVFVNFVFQVRQHEHVSLINLLATLLFRCTAILFSSYVGRRRCISKPSALRANIAIKQQYLLNLRCLRQVDVLELCIRLQTALLTLDYCLSHLNWCSIVLVTLPFVMLFLLGYYTQRNGFIVLLLLCVLAGCNRQSMLLRFNFVSTLSTVAAAILALCVGPGVLTMDEWLATTQQLYY